MQGEEPNLHSETLSKAEGQSHRSEGFAEASAAPPSSTHWTPKPVGKRSKWLLWTAGAFGILILAAGTIVTILLHRAEPLLRAALVDSLEKRFHSRVDLEHMHVSIVDGFQVEANGLKIWLPPQDQAPAAPKTVKEQQQSQAWRTEPWIVVGKIRFHATWQVAPGQPIVISVIHVQDARVQLPPKEDRPKFSSEDASSSRDSKSSNSGLFRLPRVVIQKVVCDNALLEIERTQEPGKPPKVPLDFQLKNITLVPDGKGGPIAFDVDMVNAKPVGQIHTTGHFGPWVADDPGLLPINGDYKFDHADLSTIKGIAGILSSTGHYQGTLHEITVDGQTQTPEFRLQRVSLGRGVMLTTRFHAIVDGTNGNTWLQPVDAMLGHTHIVARGQVVRAEDAAGKAHGHDILLDVSIDRGRIEDILRIAANGDAPFLTGNLTLASTHFHLPANPEGQDISVWERLQLEGAFHLSQARFSSEKVQGRIEELSLRGQGKPKELKTTNPTSILSDMQGHFKLGGGDLQLPDLVYEVPGSEIVMHGTYGLKSGSLAFDGDAKLQASLSAVVGGWKGALLSPLDHYLHKNGAGTDVPIHVDGTRKDPKFGVDFNRLGKTDAEVRVKCGTLYTTNCVP